MIGGEKVSFYRARVGNLRGEGARSNRFFSEPMLHDLHNDDDGKTSSNSFTASAVRASEEQESTHLLHD